MDDKVFKPSFKPNSCYECIEIENLKDFLVKLKERPEVFGINVIIMVEHLKAGVYWLELDL